jgi:hypothetical protein
MREGPPLRWSDVRYKTVKSSIPKKYTYLSKQISPNFVYIYNLLGRAVAQWLRHYATNRQVAGSIPDGVIGIFQWHNPSGRTMVLRSTQPLIEMSTRCISWGEGGRCVRMTNLPPSCAVVMKSGNLNFLGPCRPRHARPVKGLLYLYLYISYYTPFNYWCFKFCQIRNPSSLQLTH